MPARPRGRLLEADAAEGFLRKYFFGIRAETTCVRSTTSLLTKSMPMLASEKAFASVRPFSAVRNLIVSMVALRMARSRSQSKPMMM
jgi:hypothetical protein